MITAADVAKLTGMGFTDADARVALQKSASVQDAMEYLLSRPADPPPAHTPIPSGSSSPSAASAVVPAASAENTSQAVASVRSPGPSNAAIATTATLSSPSPLPASTAAAKPRALLRTVNDVRPSDLFERFACITRQGHSSFAIIREVSESQVSIHSFRLLRILSSFLLLSLLSLSLSHSAPHSLHSKTFSRINLSYSDLLTGAVSS
jgi:hypothetical protein